MLGVFFIAVYICSSPGSLNAAPCPPVSSVDGLLGDLLGTSLAGAGDINSDGYSDYIVGVPDRDLSIVGQGFVYVISGKDRDTLYSFPGTVGGFLGVHFGNSVAGGADVNNDGVPDIIIGAYSYDAGTIDAGRVYVYSGANGAVLHIFDGETSAIPGDRFGCSVSSAGDMNNDGHDDILIGAYNNDGLGNRRGRAYVYSGANGSLLYSWDGEANMDMFGTSVAGGGDMNGDGFPDIVVVARANPDEGFPAARVYAFSGADGSLLHKFEGDPGESVFFYSLGPAGDINNDGFSDIVWGTTFSGGSIWDSTGRVFVYSGFTGDTLYIFSSGMNNDRFGYSTSGAGDVNNDGFDDIVVGAPEADNARGRIYVYSGFDGGLLRIYTGLGAGHRIGEKVTSAGDVNIDGFTDLLVGAPWSDIPAQAAGQAYVFLSAQECVACCDIPGDANNSGSVNISDVTFLIARIFASGLAPSCSDEGDADGNNTVNIADVTFLIARIFAGGSAPVCGNTGI